MKKLAFIAALILGVCSFGASAQSVSFDSPDNKPYFGVRLGLDISCPTDIKFSNVAQGTSLSVDAYKGGAGFDLGAVYNIPLFMNLYFEPGVSIYYNTMGLNMGDLDVDDNLAVKDVKGSVRRFGFRIPLVAGYHADFTDFKLSFFTGPVVSTGIYGRNHVSAKVGSASLSESENCYNDNAENGSLNRFDIGWKIGAGVTYDKFVLQLSGTIGMCDMYKNGNGGKFHDNNVALTVGYNFSL